MASLTNDEGEAVFNRKWNHEFIDLPVVEKKKQRQPMVSREEVEQIILLSTDWYRVFFALLPGAGLRVGEALALEASDLFGNVLRVRQNLDQRKLGTPKSDAGVREVDLAPELANMLRDHIGSRTGFIFGTRKGGPIIQRNVLRVLHSMLAKAGIKKQGFHGFRRFRTTHLRKNAVPEDLIKFWLGHAPESVTDGYSKLKEDIWFRAMVAGNVGLGFELYPVAPQIAVAEWPQVA